MKKIIISLLVFACFALYGCNTNNENLYEFNPASLSDKLKETTFKPELPTKLPIKVDNTEVNSPESQSNVISILFSNKSGHMMELRAVHGKVNTVSGGKMEKVKIKSGEGSYHTNDQKAMMLDWDKNGIHYTLTYYTEQSGKKIDKSSLIKAAESFK